ncbi:HD-GYP domain-containing protein [Eubacterium xylanophilum]|uniref:HD-GYP domain-containing protein n=1 Tax=Eubacterium xylanophilum TaxID=39497 RepID=UPI0004AC719D|nr:HD domain-containing phosphohydrolase [Eubacterium xylanophilum]
MNIMLALCAICANMAILLMFTRFLTPRRRLILILMEVAATLLLGFDRAAYLYKGDISDVAYIMVRLSNFMVFFLTSAIVFIFNIYITDLLLNEGKLEVVPKRLKFIQVITIIGMLMAVVSHFTGLYYYIDSNNVYHRGPGFLLCYVIPVIAPIVQFSVIRAYKKKFSRLIYVSLTLYVFIPIIVGIIQIFTYGLSIVNMAMVLVSISLYIFSYLDVNDAIERKHQIEVENLEKDQQSMKRLFDQTAMAFVKAVEKRDASSVGHSLCVAKVSRIIAERAGKNKEECDEVYYASLLHDVGLIGIADAEMHTSTLDDKGYERAKLKSTLSADILANITEYPYLSQAAKSVCEKYDGSGYPDGLKGEEIPDISRIIAVANAYDILASKDDKYSARSYQVMREEFIKQSGKVFDPKYADIMIKILDEKQEQVNTDEKLEPEKAIKCSAYREEVTTGVLLKEEKVSIKFNCNETKSQDSDFSAPSIIVFDSDDRSIHSNSKAIEEYRYVEFGEVWFDGNFICTSARNIETIIKDDDNMIKDASEYEIIAGKYEDHLLIIMRSATQTLETIIALPDNSNSAYISLTGENCDISNIVIKRVGACLTENSIRKIVKKINYTNRLESDIPNVQIDRTCSAFTEGILLNDDIDISFHSRSLPSSNLVWQCPYVLLYYSDDGRVYGRGYYEYALIKLNGEGTGKSSLVDNTFTMSKSEDFPGWDEWKRRNKEGLEYLVSVEKNKKRVKIISDNLGIHIENITNFSDKIDKVYVSLTGDQVALTDIRVE